MRRPLDNRLNRIGVSLLLLMGGVAHGQHIAVASDLRIDDASQLLEPGAVGFTDSTERLLASVGDMRSLLTSSAVGFAPTPDDGDDGH